jgi:hypothetical protein
VLEAPRVVSDRHQTWISTIRLRSQKVAKFLDGITFSESVGQFSLGIWWKHLLPWFLGWFIFTSIVNAVAMVVRPATLDNQVSLACLHMPANSLDCHGIRSILLEAVDRRCRIATHPAEARPWATTPPQEQSMPTPSRLKLLTTVGASALLAVGIAPADRTAPDTKHRATVAAPAQHPAQPARPSDDGHPALRSRTSDCTTDSWFDPVPHGFEPGCGEVPILPLSPADVNADGSVETFSVPDGLVLITGHDDGAPQGMSDAPVRPLAWNDVLVRSALMITPTGPKPVQVSLLSLAPLFAEGFVSELPANGAAIPCVDGFDGRRYGLAAAASGWADCDADGDLDLVVRVRLQEWIPGYMPGVYCDPSLYFVGNYLGDRLAWFENIGFEATPPPVAGDLTGDGAVDGEDLAIVLANWGP